MRTRSIIIISVCKITVSFFMTFILILTMGCSSDKGKKEETSSYSKLNPFSKDADEGKACADVVKILLDQKFHYKNDEAIRLAHNALLMIHANPWPLSELDEKFGQYDKYSLQDGLRSSFIYYTSIYNTRLSYEHADEIAAAFADMNELTKYTVSVAGEKINRDKEGEYHVINLHIEYPDVEKINQRALETLNAALDAKFPRTDKAFIDPASVISSTSDKKPFEKLNALLRLYMRDNRKAQFMEIENLTYESYMKVLKDTAHVPYKIYDGKVTMMCKETKDGIPAYVFYDKDHSLLALNINIWHELDKDLIYHYARYRETVVSFAKVGSFKGIAYGKHFSIAPYEVTIEKKYGKYIAAPDWSSVKNPQFGTKGTKERTADSNVAYLEITVGLIFDNNMDEDINWKYSIKPTYGTIKDLYLFKDDGGYESMPFYLEVPKNTKKKFHLHFVTDPYPFDDDKIFKTGYADMYCKESEMADGILMLSVEGESSFELPLKVVPAKG